MRLNCNCKDDQYITLMWSNTDDLGLKTREVVHTGLRLNAEHPKVVTKKQTNKQEKSCYKQSNNAFHDVLLLFYLTLFEKRYLQSCLKCLWKSGSSAEEIIQLRVTVLRLSKNW